MDYITAATYQDMKIAVANFNHIIANISPLQKSFDCYELKRIDYCINFDLSELAPDCSPELIMNLIRRSNIPSYYNEWTKYDSTSHRSKSKPSSFYLVSKSVNINCYSKYMQLQERSLENEDKGYPPIPQSTLDAAKTTSKRAGYPRHPALLYYTMWHSRLLFYCIFIVLQFMVHSLYNHLIISYPVNKQIPMPFKMNFMKFQLSQPLASTIPKTVSLFLQHFYCIIEILHQTIRCLGILQHKINICQELIILRTCQF